MKRAPVNFLRDRFWSRFIDQYISETHYWYQPKGLAVKEESIPLIRKRLRLLRKYQGRDWGDCQRTYTKELVGKGLVGLRKAVRRYSKSDYSAIARMNKAVLDSLGFAWVDKGSKVWLTAAGDSFLRAREPASVVEKQLLKYQVCNPCVARSSGARGVRVIPHVFLVELLLCFPDKGIDTDEYVLFVSRAKDHEQFGLVRERIARFRRLSPDDRSKLISILGSVPIGSRSGKAGRRTSLYNTIRLNAPYALDFLCFPRYIGKTKRDGRAFHRISDEMLSQAVDVARVSRPFHIEFEDAKDWFSFYGESGKSGGVLDALEYYEKKTDVARAVDAFKSARRMGLRSEGIAEYRRLRISEKLMEDILEHNLSLLEEGLTLVGRQYATVVGPIDLLAMDRRQTYVVIELKKARTSDRVLGQTQRYIGHVSKELVHRGKKVRGMIVVASRPDRKLLSAMRGAANRNLALYRFRLSVSVEKIDYRKAM